MHLLVSFFPTASRPAMEPNQPLTKWVLESLFLGVKRPGREADRSPPFSAEAKNAWGCTTTYYVFVTWCLIKRKIHLHGVVLD
jgi:hypothetical protein